MKNLLILFCFLSVIACRKKADCSGTVFSKHGVPMPKLPMMIEYSEGGKNQVVDYYQISTDESGHFSFNKKIPKKRTLEGIVVTVGDSGSFRSNSKPTRDMEIVLQ
jgi:hypothetical protein